MTHLFIARIQERLALFASVIAIAFVFTVVSPSQAARAAAVPDAAAVLTHFHCPAHLVQQPVADALPQGWSVHGPPGDLPLQRVAFYDGDPAGMGTLAPESTRRNGLVETSTWSFDGGDSARVWLGCLYRGATAVVARPLPAGLRQCSVALRLTTLGDPSETLSVQCR